MKVKSVLFYNDKITLLYDRNLLISPSSRTVCLVFTQLMINKFFITDSLKEVYNNNDTLINSTLSDIYMYQQTTEKNIYWYISTWDKSFFKCFFSVESWAPICLTTSGSILTRLVRSWESLWKLCLPSVQMSTASHCRTGIQVWRCPKQC